MGVYWCMFVQFIGMVYGLGLYAMQNTRYHICYYKWNKVPLNHHSVIATASKFERRSMPISLHFQHPDFHSTKRPHARSIHPPGTKLDNTEKQSHRIVDSHQTILSYTSEKTIKLSLITFLSISSISLIPTSNSIDKSAKLLTRSFKCVNVSKYLEHRKLFALRSSSEDGTAYQNRNFKRD